MYGLVGRWSQSRHTIDHIFNIVADLLRARDHLCKDLTEYRVVCRELGLEIVVWNRYTQSRRSVEWAKRGGKAAGSFRWPVRLFSTSA